jgi:glucose-1-phosphate adenylyltransferase
VLASMGATVVRSVLSSRVCVESGSVLEESVVLPGARVGRDCQLHRVIVDAGVTSPTAPGSGMRMDAYNF